MPAEFDYKAYLGDSAYADFDGYGITLTTDNGEGPSNTIYLEPEVYGALEKWVEQRLRNRKPASAEVAP